MVGLEKTAAYIEYISRIHKVQDYIEANLAGELSLDVLAEVSGFSKFHFHRIFSGVVKVTLSVYINRIRLERAVGFILRNPSMSITQVAMQCGFSDSAVFARSFKKHYGISASEARRNDSKNCKTNRKQGKADGILLAYNEEVANTFGKEDAMMVKGNVEVRTMEEMQAIYLRHSGSYEELAEVFQGMMHKLMNWAMAKDLLDSNMFKFFAIYHDNPEFTAPGNLKTSICLAVSRDVKEEGEIGKLVVPAGKYAIGHFELEPDEHTGAWNYMFGEWLPNSGLQPDDGYVFEMYMNDPNTHPQKKHCIDIYLPVKVL